jgi:hypothetical protein
MAPPPDDISDFELIRRIADQQIGFAGAKDAWGRFYVRHHRFLSCVCIDLTGVFCTSGSEREFTLEGSWYADEEIQAGADRDAAAAG